MKITAIITVSLLILLSSCSQRDKTEDISPKTTESSISSDGTIDIITEKDIDSWASSSQENPISL